MPRSWYLKPRLPVITAMLLSGIATPVTNALILGITYPNGNTPTITDNNGNTWPALTVSADNGAGNYVSAIFVLPSVKAGQTALLVTFGANVGPFQYALTEVSNIAPSSPVDVSHGAAGVTGPNLASGSMTTTQSGDFIWSYFALATIGVGTVASYTGGSGFTLLDADTAWVRNGGFPHASQYQVQGTAGAINPGLTATLGAGSNCTYNCVSVALKTTGTPKIIQHVASSADPQAVGGPFGDVYRIPIPNPCGNANPTGLYINSINHFTMDGTIAASTWKLQRPVVGNYILLPFNVAQTSISISGITDTEGNSWSQVAGGASSGFPQFWGAKRTAGSNPNLIISIVITANSGGASPSIRSMDISGVNVTTPIDATGTAGSTDVSGVNTVAHQPDIIVPTAGDLVVAQMTIGQGPGRDATAPSGAIFDLCTFVSTFTGGISNGSGAAGTILNVTSAVTNGPLRTGMTVFGPGATTGTTISSLGTGTGGAGTYNVNNSQLVTAGSSMTAGQTDANLIENSDACAHLYNAPAATLNWSWLFTYQTSNSVVSTAVAIKSA